MSDTSSQLATSASQRVAIIVVSFHSSEDIRILLQSLALLEDREHFVIVVENSPNDPESDALGAAVRRAGHEYVVSPENRGFAAANNIGIHLARSSGAEFVWLLNPDTVVEPSALRALLDAAMLEPGAAFGSKVLYGSRDGAEALAACARTRDGGAPGRIWSAGGGIDRERREVSMFGWGEPDDGRFDTPRECDYLPGCSMLIPMSVIERVGLMPEEFFMYFEETEWCSRMTEHGVRLKYVPQSVVWHRFEDEKLQGPQTVYYYNRSRLRFWYQHAPFLERLRLVWRTLRTELPSALRALRQAPDDRMRGIFRAHCAAYWHFLRGKTGKR